MSRYILFPRRIQYLANTTNLVSNGLQLSFLANQESLCGQKFQNCNPCAYYHKIVNETSQTIALVWFTIKSGAAYLPKTKKKQLMRKQK